MDAKGYGLHETKIPERELIPHYGEIMVASDDSKGGLMTINESKGKRIISLSGGTKKLFIFEEENGTCVG